MSRAPRFKTPPTRNQFSTKERLLTYRKQQGYWAYEANAIYARAADVRSSLFQRSEDHVSLLPPSFPLLPSD